MPRRIAGALLLFSFYARAQDGLVSFPTHIDSAGLAVADLNGDGTQDIVVSNQRSDDINVYLSSAPGVWTALEPIALQSGIGLGPIAVADLNKDGKQDLIVATTFGRNVLILLGNGDGSFRAPVAFPVSGLPRSVVLGDFNGDGNLDIAVVAASDANTGGFLSLLPGRGDGTFQSAVVTPLSNTPLRVLSADFTRDGKLDLAILSSFSPVIEIFQNAGAFKFQMISSSLARDIPYSVASGDFNGDGIPDLAVSTHDSLNNPFVLVFLVQPNGSLGEPRALTSLPWAQDLVVSDFNADGKQDIVVAHCCDRNVGFYAGNGDGTFRAEIPAPGLIGSTLMVASDLLGKGNLGLVTVENHTNQAGTVSLLPNPLWPSLSFTNLSTAGFWAGPQAPGAMVSAFSDGLVSGSAITVLDALGVARPAAVISSASGQVNYIVPPATAPGLATISAASGPSGKLQIVPVAPGIFTLNASNLIAANVLRIRGATQTVEAVYQIDASGAIVPLPLDLGPATDQVYLQIYGTGLRNHAASADIFLLAGRFGNAPVPVLYTGPQGAYEGLDQVNVLLPRSFAAQGPGLQIVVVVDGRASNPATLVLK